jgi:hypothetical protein
MSLDGFLHDDGRGLSWAPFDHEPKRIVTGKLHALHERDGCQSVVGDVKNSNGGMKQLGKPARDGHRRRRVDRAVERN